MARRRAASSSSLIAATWPPQASHASRNLLEVALWSGVARSRAADGPAPSAAPTVPRERWCMDRINPLARARTCLSAP
eukprot:2336521-Pyramimonas_sp.AAC.1